MELNSPKLVIEINQYELFFLVSDIVDENKFNLIYSKKTQADGIKDNQIINHDLFLNNLKENIFLIEKKLNHIFKEAIVILNIFEHSIINLSSFKKLNGSQLTKQNITYLINSLRSIINEIEHTKKVIHIFNSNYKLDNKKTENLPIGLFGDFYSHELSFFLINTNDHKNLQNIFEKCNLKIKKIISKSFLDGINLIKDKINLEEFFILEIKDNDSKLIYFDNNSLKFTQNFAFGMNLILSDISKITKLNKESVKNILANLNFSNKNTNEDFVEEVFFKSSSYRKIRKSLILDIAKARIEELAEIMIFKNRNNTSFLKKKAPIFLIVDDKEQIKILQKMFLSTFSKENTFETKLIPKLILEKYVNNVNILDQFGWKSEAVPIVQKKKSIIARFFNFFFD